ncbi:MAG: glycosyltransferase family 2 protein [Cyanobacteria bacterium]|nr:glycosyltransferase family 2 protein [Cyanobacteriota bacterium]
MENYPSSEIQGYFEASIAKSLNHFSGEGCGYHLLPRTPEGYHQMHLQALQYRRDTWGSQPPCDLITVLVPTVPSRKALMLVLYQELVRQGAKVVWDDSVDLSIGEKRNRLLQQVQTPYFTFVDDDDWIRHDYISCLRQGIVASPVLPTPSPQYAKDSQSSLSQNSLGPDYIVFDMLYLNNQRPPQLIRSGLEFEGWHEASPLVQTRNVMHTMCFRTEKVQQIKFPPVYWGEDRLWAQDVRYVLQTQHRIEEPLYVYEFLKDRSQTASQADIDSYYHYMGKLLNHG